MISNKHKNVTALLYLYWPSGVWMDGATYGSVRQGERERRETPPPIPSHVCSTLELMQRSGERQVARPPTRAHPISHDFISRLDRAHPPTRCTRIDNGINDVLDPWYNNKNKSIPIISGWKEKRATSNPKSEIVKTVIMVWGLDARIISDINVIPPARNGERYGELPSWNYGKH